MNVSAAAYGSRPPAPASDAYDAAGCGAEVAVADGYEMVVVVVEATGLAGRLVCSVPLPPPPPPHTHPHNQPHTRDIAIPPLQNAHMNEFKGAHHARPPKLQHNPLWTSRLQCI